MIHEECKSFRKEDDFMYNVLLSQFAIEWTSEKNGLQSDSFALVTFTRFISKPFSRGMFTFTDGYLPGESTLKCYPLCCVVCNMQNTAFRKING